MAQFRQFLERDQDAPHRCGYRQADAPDSKLYSLASRVQAARMPSRPSPVCRRTGRPSKRRSSFVTAASTISFVSFDLCCRGTQSTYRTMVGRSHPALPGPTWMREGKPMLQGGGTELLEAIAGGWDPEASPS